MHNASNREITGQNNQIEKALMETGPWAKEAIWIDDDSRIYLLCAKDTTAVYAKVSAFLFLDGKWQEYAFDLYQGAPIVSFTTPDGDRILEARAKMYGKQLRLYDFKVYAENLTLPYEDLTLSAFPYQEQKEQLPFETA